MPPSTSGARRAAAILDLLRVVERTALAAITLLMAFLYVLNVAVRVAAPGLGPAFAWIEEATLFLLAWSVFLGLGLVLERGRHIAMTALFDRLPARPRRLLGLAINLAGLLFALHVAKLSLDLTLFVARSGQDSPTLEVSMAWLYAAMPIGFALLAVRYLAELFSVTDRFAVAGRGQDS